MMRKSKYKQSTIKNIMFMPLVGTFLPVFGKFSTEKFK